MIVNEKLISRRKPCFAVWPELDRYLRRCERACRLTMQYADLSAFDDMYPLPDKNGDHSHWATVIHPAFLRRDLESSLLQVYALLQAEGDLSFMKHLQVDRIDLCLYGNTRPFRVRIINTLNENFDYFYVKQADASRIIGLELEHILSPNRIGFLYDRETLIEEHIQGIPGDQFRDHLLGDPTLNRVRLAKEFVKFNERCFIRLLGDMHAANFVVNLIMDFDDTSYRLRSIDFDQQFYEGRRQVYQPQFFKENLDFVQIVSTALPAETVRQYQREERALIHKRMRSSHFRLTSLLGACDNQKLAPQEHVVSLRESLSAYYSDEGFLSCRNMGQILRHSLERLEVEAKIE